jgi:transposase-like protein
MMRKNNEERRNYSKGSKAEAAASAGKKEKPISRIAVDLDINENMLRRWIQQSRETAAGNCRPSPGTDGAERGAGPPAERKQGAAGRRMKS